MYLIESLYCHYPCILMDSPLLSEPATTGGCLTSWERRTGSWEQRWGRNTRGCLRSKAGSFSQQAAGSQETILWSAVVIHQQNQQVNLLSKRCNFHIVTNCAYTNSYHGKSVAIGDDLKKTTRLCIVCWKRVKWHENLKFKTYNNNNNNNHH